MIKQNVPVWAAGNGKVLLVIGWLPRDKHGAAVPGPPIVVELGITGAQPMVWDMPIAYVHSHDAALKTALETF